MVDTKEINKRKMVDTKEIKKAEMVDTKKINKHEMVDTKEIRSRRFASSLFEIRFLNALNFLDPDLETLRGADPTSFVTFSFFLTRSSRSMSTESTAKSILAVKLTFRSADLPTYCPVHVIISSAINSFDS